MSTETLLRKRYYEDPNFFLHYEETEKGLLLHCEATHYSPSVFKQMLKVFARFLNECQENGLERVFTVSPNPKFVKLFGGETVNSFYYEGIYYEEIVWDLKQQP